MFNRDRVFRLERVCGEKERGGAPLGHRVGERVESPRRSVRSAGRYVIFSLALPFTSSLSPPQIHHASSGVPIKCCSPYKISPRRGHVLMNYRVRPRDRSNYIERREPALNCPATTKRGPRKTQVMKAFLPLPSPSRSHFFLFFLFFPSFSSLTLEATRKRWKRENDIARRIVY